MSVRAILQHSRALGGDVVWRSLYQLYLGWRQQLYCPPEEVCAQFEQQLAQPSLSPLSQELVSRELLGLTQCRPELDDADLEGFLQRLLTRIGTTRLDANNRDRLLRLQTLLGLMRLPAPLQQ